MEPAVLFIIIVIRVLLVWGAFALAEQRNRTPWPWVIGAILFGLLSLIVQVFVPTRKEVRA